MKLIDIYTDGSLFHNNNIKKNLLGFSGIIFYENTTFCIRGEVSKFATKNKFNLKCESSKLSPEHSELLAIYKSLSIIDSESVKNKNIRIFSDSYNSLLKINNLQNGFNICRKKKTSDKYLGIVKKILSLINRISINNKIDFFWIKGHSGCYGNNIADNHAKRIRVPFMIKSKNNKSISKLFKNERYDWEYYKSKDVKTLLFTNKPNLDNSFKIYIDVLKYSINIELDKLKSIINIPFKILNIDNIY